MKTIIALTTLYPSEVKVKVERSKEEKITNKLPLEERREKEASAKGTNQEVAAEGTDTEVTAESQGIGAVAGAMDMVGAVKVRGTEVTAEVIKGMDTNLIIINLKSIIIMPKATADQDQGMSAFFKCISYLQDTIFYLINLITSILLYSLCNLC